MSNNGGIHSKFQERLKRIRLFNSRKRKQTNIEQEQFIKEKVKEIREVVGNEPKRGYRAPVGIFEYDEVKRSKDKQDAVKNDVVVKKENILNKTKDINHVADNKNVLSEDINLNDKQVRVIKRKKGYAYQNNKKKVNKVNETLEKERLVEELGSQILDKLKSSFEDKLDELDVLESELFFIRDSQDKELELKKIQELKRKIDDLIAQLNVITEQYNLYCGNYYIDNVIGIDDNELVDDIIDYRSLLDSYQDEKKFVKEYKLLDEFQNFYQRLIVVREDVLKIQEANFEKQDDFDIRDHKYLDICTNMLKVDQINKDCCLEIESQNEYFKNLMEKINDIDRGEYTTYHLRGVSDLISQSFRYVRLMLMSPLSGFLPGIAMQTMVTRRMIGNIYRNMHFEEVKHVYYEAYDYNSELNQKLTDINYTSDLIDDTLKDIDKLKNEFMLQYDSRIPNYDETLKKFDSITRVIERNQNKVNIIKKKLKISKKINEDKMVKVRKLNEKSAS